MSGSCKLQQWRYQALQAFSHNCPRPCKVHVHVGRTCAPGAQAPRHSRIGSRNCVSLQSMILRAVSRAAGSAARACGRQCASSASWPAKSSVSTVLLRAFSKLGTKGCTATGWAATAEHGALGAHKVMAHLISSWSVYGLTHNYQRHAAYCETQASWFLLVRTAYSKHVYSRCHAFNRPFCLGTGCQNTVTHGFAAMSLGVLQAVGRCGLAALACRGALASCGSQLWTQAARTTAARASRSLRQASSCAAASRGAAWRSLPPLRRLCTAAAGSLRVEAAVTPHMYTGCATAEFFVSAACLKRLLAAQCGAARLLLPRCAGAGGAGVIA